MCPSIFDTVMQLATSFGLSQLKGAGGQKLRLQVLQSVSSSGDLDLLKTIIDFLNITREEAREVFIRAGPLTLMKWLVEKYQFSEDDAVQAFVSACSRRDGADTARWLAEDFQLTRDALSGKIRNLFLNACSSERLELVKWLVETYQLTLDDMKGCQILVLESSVDPEIVKYLISNFTFERCDVLHSFTMACSRGCIWIAKLLAEYYEFTPSEIRRDHRVLRASNDPRVREWLLETFYDEPPPAADQLKP